MNEKKKKTIVFVCVGNTCRSPMAEAILKSEIKRLRVENVEVFSAGLKASGRAVNPYAAQTLLNKGLELSNFQSKKVDERSLTADVLIAMTEEVAKELRNIQRYGAERGILANDLKNVYSFKELAGYDVSDPYGLGEGEYLRAFGELERGMSAIIEKFVVEKPSEEASPAPKKRGRPKGSKNKKPSERKTPSKTATKKRTTKPKSKETVIQEEIKL